MFSKKPAIMPRTREQCPECNAARVRGFAKGDVLFAGSSECGCGATMAITMIYGEKEGA